MNTNESINYLFTAFDFLKVEEQKDLLNKMLSKAKAGSKVHAALTDLLTNDFSIAESNYMTSMLEQCINGITRKYEANEIYHHTTIRGLAAALEAVKAEKAPSKLVKSQKQKLEKFDVELDGVKYRRVVCIIRFDDECGNGHNSFSITGEFWGRSFRDPEMCGCCHDDLVKVFPEIEHLIKWHLCSTNGPMHYLANTTYHARTCSHEGKKPGDPVAFEKRLLLGNSKWPHKFSNAFMDYIEEAQRNGYIFNVKAVEHSDNHKGGYQFGDNYTLDTFDCKWHECPFDSLDKAQGFIDTYRDHGAAIVKIPTKYAAAVEPNIEAARSCAVWPDATLEQLQDKEALMARLPGLLEEMRADIEALGMEW